MISAFVKLLFACAQISPTDCDFVEMLPAEVSSSIFRYLDSKSLVAAASVSSRWNSVCKEDAVLRRRIRRHLRRERKTRIEAYMEPSKAVKILRQQDVPVLKFGMRNANVSVRKLPVQYEAPKSKMNSKVTLFKVCVKPDGKPSSRSLSKIKKCKSVNNTRSSRTIRL